jgi:uncharacterized protein YerC
MSQRGESHTGSKLTQSFVREIMKALQAKERAKDIAARYGVSEATVSRIRKSSTWAQITKVEVTNV